MGFQESDHTRAVTTNVEADFLRETFGVSIPHDAVDDHYAERLSHEVARRVLTVIDGTRNAMTIAELHELLDDRITQRLQSVNLDTHHNPALAVRDTLQARRVRAVLEAIRESLPAAVMNDVIRYGVPAFVPRDVNQPAHKVVLQNVVITSLHPHSKTSIGSCSVEIDTRYDLWRNTDPTQLLAELGRQIDAKKTLKTLGIRIIAVPPVPESFVLTRADLPAILAGEAEGIDLWKRYEVMEHRTAIVGHPEVRSTVDTAKLVRHRIEDPSAPGTTILVGDIASVADLETAFLDNTDNILEFITTIPPNALDDDPPAHPRSPQGNAALAEIAQRLFDEGTLPAIELNSLTAIQTEIHEQHRFFENMRKGSDNHMAAALATKLVMEHKDLRDVLLTRTETEIRADINIAQQNLTLLQLVTGLESLTAPAGGGTWNDQILKRGTFGPARAALAAAVGTSHTITVGAGPTLETFDVGEDPAHPGTLHRDTGYAWITAKEREVDNAIAAYGALYRSFNNVVNEVATRRGITTGLDIHTFAPHGGVANQTAFASSMDMRHITEDLRLHTGLTGKSRDDLAKELKKYQKELDDGAAKPVTGADAQHKVITAELMRYHGLTDNEAISGANVLRARALLDTDMSLATQRIADEQFGHDAHPTGLQQIGSALETVQRGDFGPYGNPFRLRNWGADRRDLQLIRNIAHECHVPLPHDAGQKPLWAQTEKYEDLLTAYHSLKKVRSQTYYDRTSEVPWEMRIRSTATIDQDMREISRALFLFHAKGLLQEYGPGVGLKDGDAEKILAEPTKPEHERLLRQIIESAPNPEVAHRMGHVIEHAASNTQPVRRFLSKILFGKDLGLITGAKLPFSYRALIYGNPHMSLWAPIKGIYKRVKKYMGGESSASHH